MSENSPVTIYTTFSNADEAAKITRALVEAKLISCGNVFGSIHSVYRWQGEVCEDSEAAVFMKTRIGRVDAALEMIEALHSYDSPVIEVLPVFAANEALKSFVVAGTDG